MKIKLKSKASREISQGRRFLRELDLVSLPELEEGQEVILVSGKTGEYIATALVAEQNKALGWVFTWNEEQSFNQALMTELVQEAKEKRSKFFTDDQTTAFRIFNAEGDGIGGLTADYYDGYLVLSWYSKALYNRRHQILAAFQEIYPEVKGIYGKNRFKDKGDRAVSEFLYGEQAPEMITIKENGVSYAIYLNDGWMTGIFLDQREVRDYIQSDLAAGRSILNTFSYTGAFSVAGAMGGASQTVNVDAANRSDELTARNYKLNGLSLDNAKNYVMDVFDYIRYANRHDLGFDIVVVDPPSFARTKKRTFQVQKDLADLASSLLDLVNPGGYLICSTNASSYRKDKVQADLEKVFQEAGQNVQLKMTFGLPEDFRYSEADGDDSHYLKVFVYQKD